MRIAKQGQLSRRFAVVAALAGEQLCQKCRIFNVAPVVAARVSEENIYIDMLTQRLERLQVYRRQRRNPADKHPRR